MDFERLGMTGQKRLISFKFLIRLLIYYVGWGAGSGSNNLFQVHVELLNQSVCDN